MRRRYPVNIAFNGRWIREVLIDSHYECKHPDMSDALILAIVGQLNFREIRAERVKGVWSYYAFDQLKHAGKNYRLVWCIQDGGRFLGVINCFRR